MHHVMVTKRGWLAILVLYTDMIRLWGDPEADRVRVVVAEAVAGAGAAGTGLGASERSCSIGSFSPDEKHAGMPIGSKMLS